MLHLSVRSVVSLLALGAALSASAQFYDYEVYAQAEAAENRSGGNGLIAGQLQSAGRNGSTSVSAFSHIANAEGYAYADLSTGRMGASAWCSTHTAANTLVTASGIARMKDRVTLFRNGSTAGHIPIRFDIDGWTQGNAGASVDVKIDGVFRSYRIQDRQVTILDDLLVPLTPSATFDVEIAMYANTAMNPSEFAGATADFSHTPKFSWELPEGMTYDSASKTFLTKANPVPEPASFVALAVGGFGLLAKRRRARR